MEARLNSTWRTSKKRAGAKESAGAKASTKGITEMARETIETLKEGTERAKERTEMAKAKAEMTQEWTGVAKEKTEMARAIMARVRRTAETLMMKVHLLSAIVS